jgi:hypothetical protein
MGPPHANFSTAEDLVTIAPLDLYRISDLSIEVYTAPYEEDDVWVEPVVDWVYSSPTSAHKSSLKNLTSSFHSISSFDTPLILSANHFLDSLLKAFLSA